MISKCEEKKSFSTLAVLSITSGRLITQRVDENDNGIDAMYDVVGWMTDDPPEDHQLPRFMRECRPWILQWHPHLADVNEEIDRRCKEGDGEGVQRDMVKRFGETIELQKMPSGVHTYAHPLDDFIDLFERANVER